MVGRVIVVTGGSAGIGLATAQRFARDGWSVAILARDPARLEQAVAMLRGTGASAVLGIPTDVANADEVEHAAEQVERELGPIAAWVNNAMSTVVAAADAIAPTEYARVTATTYLGQVHGTLAALRRMKPRNRGIIVQVSSGLGIRSAPLQAAYCGAKFAVTGFTDSLRSEFIADGVGVRLSIVYLPTVNTPQFGWARNHTGRRQLAPDPIHDPRLCAAAIAHAVRHGPREVWVGRLTIMLALMQRIAPGWADRKASAFKAAQLGSPAPAMRGNLDEAVPGPAAVDGQWGDRVLATRSAFYTSRQRNVVEVGLAGVLGVLAVAGAVSFLQRSRSDR